jgi:hypothetical protein
MVAVLLALTLSMSGCGLPSMIKTKGADYSFKYSSCYAASAFSEMKGTLNFVYSDTTLHIYDDGTWTINMDDPSIFIDSIIDEGTYTVEDELYTFVGFEYGFDTTGKMEEEGFRIYFIDPTGSSENAFVLYFNK